MHTNTYVMQPDQSILSMTVLKVAQGKLGHHVTMHLNTLDSQDCRIVFAVANAAAYMPGNSCRVNRDDMLLLKSFGVLCRVNSYCNFIGCSAVQGFKRCALVVLSTPLMIPKDRACNLID